MGLKKHTLVAFVDTLSLYNDALSRLLTAAACLRVTQAVTRLTVNRLSLHNLAVRHMTRRAEILLFSKSNYAATHMGRGIRQLEMANLRVYMSKNKSFLIFGLLSRSFPLKMHAFSFE